LGSATASGSGAWSYVTGSLGDGAHSLTAVATDTAGNTSAGSSPLNVTVDSTAPGAPAIAASVAGTGPLSAQVLKLKGITDTGSTVKVYDGAKLVGSAIADGSGAWSFTTAALASGAHSLTATVTDVAGNTGAVSAALNLTVDLGLPETRCTVMFF